MRINEGEISVVIPVYNSERTIISVLDSICSQTMKAYIKEIIVVNDGSKDLSAELVNEYAKNSPITLNLINKKNGGVSAARNCGMKKATGLWIAFCDSDDIWYPEKIEKQIKIINENEVDLLGGNHTDKQLKILLKEVNELHKATVEELCIKMFPQTSTIIMRRDIFEEIGGFDEQQKYAEDGNYFMKIAAKYNYYYMPEKLVCYDGGKQGFGVSGLSSNIKEMNKGSLKNLYEMFENNYISFEFYLVMRLFYMLKYIRRILIVKLRKN